jgi:DNA-binding transcriptional ArsR family regulator
VGPSAEVLVAGMGCPFVTGIVDAGPGAQLRELVLAHIHCQGDDADVFDLDVIGDPATAVVALNPIRSRLLSELTEPASAAALSARVGITRQKVNYHLRALEQHRLVAAAGERRWGGITERLLVASASSYVVSPGALGPAAADPGRTCDRLSASYLIAVAARAVRVPAHAILVAQLVFAGEAVDELTRHDPSVQVSLELLPQRRATSTVQRSRHVFRPARLHHNLRSHAPHRSAPQQQSSSIPLPMPIPQRRAGAQGVRECAILGFVATIDGTDSLW